MFHLKVFNIGTHKRRKFNPYLLFLAISPDLEMTQIWSVSYIYQVCKVLCILDFTESLGNICIVSVFVLLVLLLVFFDNFWKR